MEFQRSEGGHFEHSECLFPFNLLLLFFCSLPTAEYHDFHYCLSHYTHVNSLFRAQTVSQISKPLCQKFSSPNEYFRLTLENIQSSDGPVAHHLENEPRSAVSTSPTEQNNGREEEAVDLGEESEGDADEDDVSSIVKVQCSALMSHSIGYRNYHGTNYSFTRFSEHGRVQQNSPFNE